MIVNRVNPISLAKVAGVLYALMGLLIGGIFSIIGLVAGGMMPKDSGPAGMLFGVGAIIILPIFYGILGFIFSLIGAALYNVIAGMVGGVELDVR